jgi:superfamily II DNA/RNA helicase
MHSQHAADSSAATFTSFTDLGLPERLVDALARQGIDAPFPIQVATIPDALARRDVLGRGQTGSGKTLAFGLPMLVRLGAGQPSRPHRPKGLILVPTRELAMQVADALAPLGRTLGVHLQTAVGGVRYDKQISALRKGVDIMVATPGRLADLIEQGACSLDQVEITVLDEADQMADMGFLPDVTELLVQTPAKGQRLLFSATLDRDVDTLVEKFLTDPATHEVDPPQATVTTMAHQLLLIPPSEKFPITAAIANRPGKTLLFAKTQLGVDRLVEQLLAVGVRTAGLHGGKTQAVRTRTLAEFREGRLNTLVATDVAARGIHVDGISLVVHVDPPKDSKDYLHRAGRTARAGEAGTVVTLVLPRQRRAAFGLLERAGVTASRTEVRVNSPSLQEITGAQPPSGQPVTMEPARPARPSRRADDRGPRRYDDRPRRFEERGDRRSGERGEPSLGRPTTRQLRGEFPDRPAPRAEHRDDRGYAPRAVHHDDRRYAPRVVHHDDRGQAPRALHHDDRGFAPRLVHHDDRGFRPRTERRDERSLPARDYRTSAHPQHSDGRGLAPRTDRGDRGFGSGTRGRDDRGFTPRPHSRDDRGFTPRPHSRDDRGFTPRTDGAHGTRDAGTRADGDQASRGFPPRTERGFSGRPNKPARDGGRNPRRHYG